MKKSDLIIVAIGIIVIVAFFATLFYVATVLNNGSAGLHGGF